MLKKFFSLFVSLVLLVSNFCSLTVSAEEKNIVNYDVVGGSIRFDKSTGTITRCNCRDIPVIIPEEIEGVKVTSIGDMAFYECGSLTSITIPNSVTSIGDEAFFNCGSLTSITIPNSVTSIGDKAFCYCGITSITIPNSVTSIGDRTFYGCFSLTSITIPNSVTSIGDEAFYECENLTSITIPDSVTSIGDKAFSRCFSLTSITIPDSVTSIGDRAFYECLSLTSITIPDNVTSIGDYVFCECENLTSITIPNSVTSIGNFAFSSCRSLTSITIPNCVTSIGNAAFSNCASLTSITIPNSVTSIGGSAFSWCASLTSITIPNSVTSIGNAPFSNCGLSLAVIAEDNPNYCIENGALYNKDKTKIVELLVEPNNGVFTIPNCVTSIGGSAFYGCASLTSITIPNNVTSIGYNAFDKDSNKLIFKIYKDSYAEKYLIDESKIDPSRIVYITDNDPSKPLTLGDIDGKSGFDIDDISMLLQKVLNTNTVMPIESKEGYMEVVDADKNGVLTARDVTIILKEFENQNSAK